MKIELGWIRLGHKAHVSDPCYSVGTWCAAWGLPVRPGFYDCSIEVLDIPDWGRRVASLRAMHHRHEPLTDLVCEPWNINIGVDSGQCGIFSPESYAKLHNMDAPDGYNVVCDATADSHAAVLDYGGAVVSSTGFGDGGYSMYTYTDTYDRIVGIEIVYIPDDDVEIST